MHFIACCSLTILDWNCETYTRSHWKSAVMQSSVWIRNSLGIAVMQPTFHCLLCYFVGLIFWHTRPSLWRYICCGIFCHQQCQEDVMCRFCLFHRSIARMIKGSSWNCEIMVIIANFLHSNRAILFPSENRANSYLQLPKISAAPFPRAFKTSNLAAVGCLLLSAIHLKK